jgi:hypothetical protein
MMNRNSPAFARSHAKARAFAQRLRSETSGLAMIEFAYSLPLLVGLTGYGLEMTNLANANMKVSQAANALADNMSRVGLESSLALTQLREADVNDGFIGVDRQTQGIQLRQNARVFLSSLERNTSGGQWIHWQRCYGEKTSLSSSFGVAGDGATGTSFQGMGPSGARVTAPAAGTAVMFVEINYTYQPLFTTMFIPAKQIKYHASFIVRDDRDLTGVFNPGPVAPVNSC